MSDQVQFTYHLHPPGKATGSLLVGNKNTSFEITNICNPLYDLLKGLVSMVVEPRHLWDEDNTIWVDWFNETSCIKWILNTTDGKDLKIRIISTKDIFDESNAEVILESGCDFMEFCQAIISELDRFIKELGLLNYEQIWKKDEFPITYHLILKKYLIEHKLWKSIDNKTDNLYDEISILEA
ncbi:hypothetical protein [Saccharicrinis fermentans]|uniref:Uncharacterized protein n=1 Tax=Saccharicrinis fermentans DSM 9555 = JCM 21142 TaxID=869213 RepID=W7Y208_9BACT|nr:hypothetical protein [Saccharicrinis fermentans]GAF04915.1 hypothetical protein JCM21142_93637 [Saccharicrinis fermentans DSM 9555 = JCM 21142]